MNKNNTLLDSIKAKLGAEKHPLEAAPTGTLKIVSEREHPASTKPEAPAAQSSRNIDAILSEGGFVQLFKALEAARKEMDIEKKAVYIDEESAEVLDLLKKKARIKSNVLVSYLLQEFFIKHRDLIQELVEKRSNKFLDQ